MALIIIRMFIKVYLYEETYLYPWYIIAIRPIIFKREEAPWSMPNFFEIAAIWGSFRRTLRWKKNCSAEIILWLLPPVCLLYRRQLWTQRIPRACVFETWHLYSTDQKLTNSINYNPMWSKAEWLMNETAPHKINLKFFVKIQW